jgi:hypothetical protein
MKKIQKIIIAVFLIAVSGCSLSKNPREQDEMYIQAAALRRVSLAVEALRYENVPVEMENAELLTFATRHEPRLLEGFDNYVLKAELRNRHSLLLLCDSTGKKALIEDTGCTGPVDVHHWQKPVLPPCEFTIIIEEVCN